jgi:hypothetical protein
MEETTTTLVFNFMGRARIQKLHGRDHYVVPMVMITEGVYDGNEGAFLYPAEEIEKSEMAWNHMPITVWHPKTKKTAREPKVLNEQACGVVLNTKWNKNTKKLRAEAWFDVEKTGALDDRVVTNIQNARMTEVSTGLGLKLQKKPGKWTNGRDYVGIARDLQPDHLAVLPAGEGACSIKDGAGLFQMNQAHDNVSKQEIFPSQVVEMFWQGKFPGFTVENKAADQSLATTIKKLSDALSAKFGEPGKSWMGFVEEAYPDYVIYYNSGQLYKVDYTTDKDGNVVVDGEPEAVRREVVYKVVNGAAETVSAPDPEPPVGEKAMEEKNKVISQIITNSNGAWTEDDRTELQKLDDKRLLKMVTNAKPAEPPKKPDNPDIAKLIAGMSEEDRMLLLPEDQRRWITNKRQEEKVEKEQLIEQLVTNTACPFGKEYLNLKPVEELRGLVQMLPASESVDPNVAVPAPGFNGVPMFKVAAGAPVTGVNNSSGKKITITALSPPPTPEEWTNTGGKATRVGANGAG